MTEVHSEAENEEKGQSDPPALLTVGIVVFQFVLLYAMARFLGPVLGPRIKPYLIASVVFCMCFAAGATQYYEHQKKKLEGQNAREGLDAKPESPSGQSTSF